MDKNIFAVNIIYWATTVFFISVFTFQTFWTPKSVSFFMGYRSSRSMKNLETFKQANKIAGKFKLVGFIILVVVQIIVAAIKSFTINPLILLITFLIDIMILVACRMFTERKLAAAA